MIRIAREKEQRRRIAQELRRQRDQRENARLAVSEREWAQFSRGIAIAQRETMRAAFLKNVGDVLSEVEQFFRPRPPAPEPQTEIVFVSADEQGTARLGYRDFNPQLFARPLKWWG